MFTFIQVVVFISLTISIRVGATGLYGWDTSNVQDQAIINCLAAKNDAQFITFDAYRSNAADPDVCNELNMAKKSNIPHRDARFVPCPNCAASAETQFTIMLNNLQNNCSDVWSGRVWLDLKSYQFWSTPWHPIGMYLIISAFFFCNLKF
jgi:hypothetical protein